jgi:hypothetical protein
MSSACLTGRHCTQPHSTHARTSGRAAVAPTANPPRRASLAVQPVPLSRLCPFCGTAGATWWRLFIHQPIPGTPSRPRRPALHCRSHRLRRHPWHRPNRRPCHLLHRNEEQWSWPRPRAAASSAAPRNRTHDDRPIHRPRESRADRPGLPAARPRQRKDLKVERPRLSGSTHKRPHPRPASSTAQPGPDNRPLRTGAFALRHRETAPTLRHWIRKTGSRRVAARPPESCARNAT